MTGKASAAQLIGVATQDITPPLGVALAGYGTSRGRADELGHPLRAEALACHQGGEGWVLVTADAIGFPCDLVARVRPRIAAATGLPEAAIVLAATHTHSAPSGLRPYHADLEEVDHQYREQTEARLAAVAAAAWESAEPGAFEVARAAAPDLGHNRRLMGEDGQARNEWEDHEGRHPGYFDPAVLLVGVRRPDGCRAAVVVNYGCHPVTLGPMSTAISADYVGYLKDHLEEAGAAAVALFALAGAANINPRVAIHAGSEYPRAMGRQLGEICAAALEQAQPVAGGPVRACRVPWAFAARYDWPENTGRRKGDPVRTEVVALRAGDLAAVTAPGELCSEYAARFRSFSPAPHTLVVSLANDSVGYLVTDETQGQGALEAMRAAGEALEQPLLECARRALAGVAG
ncbi:MAG: neutral/alkaline non-lysosomal ceramidase N-terminal domain-containing protein [Gemmatimonadota bacterium]